MAEVKAPRRGASPLLNDGRNGDWYSRRHDGYGRGHGLGSEHGRPHGRGHGRGHGHGPGSWNQFGGIHYRGDNVAAGIYRGPHGWAAYYNRHNRERYHRHHHHHYYRCDPWYWGAWHGGYYYPYGYTSHYDYYYYRYPYSYVSVGYVPSWTVYVDPVDVVYVESPVQTVYVERDEPAEASYPATEVIVEPDSVPPPETVVPDASTPGPYVPIEPAPGEAQPQVPDGGDPESDAALPGTEGKVPIEVEPQKRIPVNNALLADAARMFQEGRYEESRTLLVQAVLSDPENGFAELAYALGHFAVGEYDPAAEAVRRGAALVPDVIDLPIDVVRQYGQPKDFETHLQALQLYAAAHPEDQNAWFLLGYVMYSSGKPQEAQRAFEKAVKLNPSDTYAAVFRDAAGRVKLKPVE